LSGTAIACNGRPFIDEIVHDAIALPDGYRLSACSLDRLGGASAFRADSAA
jgi:hypothetical protein